MDADIFILPIPDDVTKIIKEKAAGSELILAVGPEDISLGRRRAPGKLVEAEVYVTEPLGSEVIVDLKVGDNLVKAKTTPDLRDQIGEKVWIGFNKEKMHLFDKKLKRRSFSTPASQPSEEG